MNKQITQFDPNQYISRKYTNNKTGLRNIYAPDAKFKKVACIMNCQIGG